MSRLKEVDLESSYSVDDFFVIDEIQALTQQGKKALLHRIREDPPGCSLYVWGDGYIHYLDNAGCTTARALYELGVRKIVAMVADDAQDYLHTGFPTMTHIPTLLKDAPLVSKNGYEEYVRRMNNGQMPPYHEPLETKTQ